jgi:hypothetical protein
MNRTFYLLSFISSALLAMVVTQGAYAVMGLSVHGWDNRLLPYIAGVTALLFLPALVTYFRGRYIDMKWLVLIPVIAGSLPFLPLLAFFWDRTLIPAISVVAVIGPIVLYTVCATIGGRRDV